MTEQQLHITLNSGRLSKAEINQLVDQLTAQPELVGHLLQEIFDQDGTDSFNASWTFDHLMRKKLVYLLPHFEKFTKGLEGLKSESIIRSMAHVCEFSMEAYFKTKDPVFVQNITPEQLERIVTVCFDWLIGNHKVAAKVFAMSSLYHLGQKYDWVHPELKMVLEQQVHDGTAAYKSRASKTLAKLRKAGF
ncbi:adenylosuccinate lyase [Flagellimonas sp.]|uniref:adenylosuccinate lyase n=1 Tax=Flagellimonas sp. TaxID=2058762 RepID=UPI003B503C32